MKKIFIALFDPIATNYYTLATIDDGSCCYGFQLVIDILTDNYSYETSWQLVNQSGASFIKMCRNKCF